LKNTKEQKKHEYLRIKKIERKGYRGDVDFSGSIKSY